MKKIFLFLIIVVIGIKIYSQTVIELNHNHYNYNIKIDSLKSDFTTDTNVYYCGSQNIGIVQLQATYGNAVKAYPFKPERNFTIDYVAIEVTSGSTGAIMFGIYNSTAATKLYPGTLLTSFTAFNAGSATVQGKVVPAFTLYANRVYWIAYTTNATPQLRAMNPAGSIDLLGYVTGTGGQITGLTVARVYDGTLPTTYPGGATYISNAYMPLLFMRQK